jgi:hypothetical protein
VLLVPCLSAPLAHAPFPVVINVPELSAPAANTAKPIVIDPAGCLEHDTALPVDILLPRVSSILRFLQGEIHGIPNETAAYAGYPLRPAAARVSDPPKGRGEKGHPAGSIRA